MRFRPEQHLSRPGDIRAVREKGRRLDCRAFTLWWKHREAPSTPVPAGARVCVIASRAAVGPAVRRNRAKRRLREVFREQQTLVPAGCDVLLIARAAATDWPMTRMKQTFEEACRKITPLERSQPT